ncbi:MAG: hypothetical protein QM752_07180 [Gammaproteobacteria bacterium]
MRCTKNGGLTHLCNNALQNINFIAKNMYNRNQGKIIYETPKADIVNLPADSDGMAVLEVLVSECHKYFFTQLVTSCETVLSKIYTLEKGNRHLKELEQKINLCQCQIKEQSLKKLKKLKNVSPNKPTFSDYINQIFNKLCDDGIEEDALEQEKKVFDVLRVIRNYFSHGHDLQKEELKIIAESEMSEAGILVLRGRIVSINFVLYSHFLYKILLVIDLICKRANVRAFNVQQA